MTTILGDGPVAVAACLCASAAAWLCVRASEPLVGGRDPRRRRPPAAAADDGWLHRYRVPLSALAGCGGAVLLGGALWPVAALAGAVACWAVIARAEPRGRRRRRQEVRRQLPHVLALFASALRGGGAPGPALGLVAEALPGPPTQAARVVAARLALGTDPGEAWRSLAAEPGLAVWGRAMARAHETGAPVVEVVERLAEELARDARAEVEDLARTVGVRAAVPLGLCLLPAFLLVGIVPLAGGLLGAWW